MNRRPRQWAHRKASLLDKAGRPEQRFEGEANIIQKILFKLLKTVAKTFSEEVQEETYRAIQASGMSLLRLGAQKASLKYVWKYEDY